ncbi:MAG: hypothetical protein GC206_17135 [Alphaproteobacteria bacterium]|nr:hypothetical protein [Alphaproteobacteria bacterium]
MASRNFGTGHPSAIQRLSDKRGGGGGTPATQAATVYTSNDTFVAPAAGVYRVACISSGATGSVAANAGGGGSGPIQYAEITLTASENVAITIGAAASGATTSTGNAGNRTRFGGYVSSGIALPAVGTVGGSGFSGGNGTAAQNVLSAGSDGFGTGAGVGQGAELLTFLGAKFPDVTFTSGTQGMGGSEAYGGAGVNVNGSGNYGRAGGGYSAGTTEASIAGALIVAGPYPS